MGEPANPADAPPQQAQTPGQPNSSTIDEINNIVTQIGTEVGNVANIEGGANALQTVHEYMMNTRTELMNHMDQIRGAWKSQTANSLMDGFGQNLGGINEMIAALETGGPMGATAPAALQSLVGRIQDARTAINNVSHQVNEGIQAPRTSAGIGQPSAPTEAAANAEQDAFEREMLQQAQSIQRDLQTAVNQTHAQVAPVAQLQWKGHQGVGNATPADPTQTPGTPDPSKTPANQTPASQVPGPGPGVGSVPDTSAANTPADSTSPALTGGLTPTQSEPGVDTIPASSVPATTTTDPSSLPSSSTSPDGTSTVANPNYNPNLPISATNEPTIPTSTIPTSAIPTSTIPTSKIPSTSIPKGTTIDSRGNLVGPDGKVITPGVAPTTTTRTSPSESTEIRPGTPESMTNQTTSGGTAGNSALPLEEALLNSPVAAQQASAAQGARSPYMPPPPMGGMQQRQGAKVGPGNAERSGGPEPGLRPPKNPENVGVPSTLRGRGEMKPGAQSGSPRRRRKPVAARAATPDALSSEILDEHLWRVQGPAMSDE
jgi:hypothetical protein